jgi:hypothetical protein
MNSMTSNLHGLPSRYLSVILLLATGMCAYGLINLSSVAFREPNYRPDIEQSDKLVIGLFNVVIGVVAICTVALIGK